MCTTILSVVRSSAVTFTTTTPRLTLSPGSRSFIPRACEQTVRREMSSRRSARLIAASEAKASPAAAARLAAAMPPPPAATKSRKRKAVDENDVQNGSEKTELPTTPQKKRATTIVPPVTPVPPPATPTPADAKVFGEPMASTTTPAAKPKAIRRLANTNRTNAQLLSPETSRLVARHESESPTKAPPREIPGSTSPVTTTENLLEVACAHLIKVDERMRPLIENHHCRVFSPEGLAEKIDPFESLCSGIISQQVSGAAAKAIKKKFVELFYPPAPEAESAEVGNTTVAPRFPHPSEVAACKIEKLRTAGLSQRKAEYVQGLAEKFTSGELSAQMIADAPYDELFEKLIAVRGLGKWSVEMFACFALKRMDVFSLGDLGVQRGMAAFVGRDVAKLKNKGGKWKYMSEQDMIELSDKFVPYRTLFMWYMWRVEETDISTME